MSENTTTLTPKQREAIYEAWVAALRSGQYKQGRAYLESDGKFCCFGVLCHVLHQRPELGIKMDRLVIPGEATEYSTPTSPGYRGRVPGIASALGLSTTMPRRRRSFEDMLVTLNDAKGANFAEIAQFIKGAVMPMLRAKGVLPSAPASARQEAPHDLYLEWRDFYAEKVSSWMSLDELRVGCGKLQTVDNPSPEVLLVHAMHALEEREQRDEALLRQALKALERGAWNNLLAKDAVDTIIALRERLGEKEQR